MITLRYSGEEPKAWKPLAGSTAVHLALLTILLSLPLTVVQKPVESTRQHVTLILPRPVKPVPLRAPTPALAKRIPPQPPLTPPRPPDRPPLVQPPPPVQTPKIAIAEAPRVEVPKAPLPPKAELQATTAPPPSPAPRREVIVGGFGEPIGTPRTGPVSRMPLPTVGSFDQPAGEGKASGRKVVASAGFGSAPDARAVTRPHQVVATGFDRAQGTGTAAANTQVRTGVFQQNETAPAVAAKPAPAEPITSPVEILFKPKPVYTEEARRIGLQGEVWLKILFAANGSLQVLETTKSLGHGLDEAATQAARQIRFTPARRRNMAVDSIANVRIIFQLAE